MPAQCHVTKAQTDAQVTQMPLRLTSRQSRQCAQQSHTTAIHSHETTIRSHITTSGSHVTAIQSHRSAMNLPRNTAPGSDRLGPVLTQTDQSPSGKHPSTLWSCAFFWAVAGFTTRVFPPVSPHYTRDRFAQESLHSHSSSAYPYSRFPSPISVFFLNVSRALCQLRWQMRPISGSNSCFVSVRHFRTDSLLKPHQQSIGWRS